MFLKSNRIYRILGKKSIVKILENPVASFWILFLCEFNLWQEFLEVLLLAGSLRAEVREWADCLIAGQTTTGQFNQNFK
jgi:hypothetical protein